MYCPQCRAEYRPGFKFCSDCHVALMGELPPEAPTVAAERMRRTRFKKWGGLTLVFGVVLVLSPYLLPRDSGALRDVLVEPALFVGLAAYVAGACLVARGKGFPYAAGVVALAGPLLLLLLAVWHDKALPVADEWDEHLEELGAGGLDQTE
ncbi:MAG: hypothetical protein JST22_11975 [Bacteroidetes bacterium]|nr:hypothetical protein [Bacteroidota bacterium]